MNQPDPQAQPVPDASGTESLGSIALHDFWAAVTRGKNDEYPLAIISATATDNSITVVYTHPLWPAQKLGYRRVWPPHYIDNNPHTNGVGAYQEISEPLGTTADELTADENGIAWWGDPIDSTPRPQDDLGQ